MSKTITLDRVPLGGTFTLDGVRFVKLAGDNVAAFVLTEGIPTDMGCVQFEDDDATMGDHNNFNGSLVQKEIERWMLDKHGQYIPTPDGELEIHHIKPVSQGGGDEPENLITLCKHCHRARHKKLGED